MRVERHDAREADDLVALLGDPVAAARLGGEELDHVPLAQPVRPDRRVGQLDARRHHALAHRHVVEGALRERERGGEVARGALAEGELTLGGH